MKYVYARTKHPKNGGKLQKGIPRYPDGCGWQPLPGEPVFVKPKKGHFWHGES